MGDQHDAAGETPMPGGDDVFVADPSAIEDWDEPEAPKWPKVVGIISIVWGSLGVICNGLGVAFSALGQNMMSGMSGELPPVMTNPPPSQMVSVVLGAVVAIVLIVAGAFATLRKPATRPLHLVYAVLAVVLATWAISVQLDVQAQIGEWVENNPDTQFAQQQAAAGPTNAIIGLACGGVLGYAWPLFCIVWFGFVKTKPEQLTGGVEAPAA